jgi:hypothetical protein
MPYDDTYDKEEGDYDESDRENFGDEMEEVWYGKQVERDGGIKNIKKYIKTIILTKKFQRNLAQNPELIGDKLVDRAKQYIEFKFPFIYEYDLSPNQKLEKITKFFESFGITVTKE